MRRLLLILCLLCGTGAQAQQHLTLGVLAYRPKPIMVQRYQPLVDYLNTRLPEVHIELAVLDQPAIDQAVARNQLDLVFTNPSHYIRLRSENSLASLLGTLSRPGLGGGLSALGGVILTRAENSQITTLEALRGARIAIPGVHFLGGYQTQALELLEVGIRLPEEAQLITVGSHDAVIEALLSGRAEVGFVRSGVVEQLGAEGRIDPARLRVIHPQSLYGFPWRLSTRLYPEWPLLALPQVDEEVVRHLTAALLLLEEGDPACRAAGIRGFIPPLDYHPVDELARRLHLPPYSGEVPVGWVEFWRQHRLAITLLCVSALLVLLLSLLLARRNRLLSYALQGRHAAEQAHRRSEERFELAMRGANDGLWDWDLVSNQIYFSPRWKEMLGYAPGELANQLSSWEALVEQGDRMHALARLNDYLQGQVGEYKVEYRMRHKEGHWVHILSRAQLVRDAAGNPVRLVGTHVDITQMRAVAARLEEERNRAEQYLKVARVMLVALDREARVSMINPRGCEILGLSAEAIVGRHWLDEFIPEAARAAVTGYYYALMAGEDTLVEFVENPVLDAQGRIHLIAWHNSVVRDAKGEIVGALSSGEDITEQRRMQRSLEQALAFRDGMLKTLPDLVWLKDREGHYLACNRLFERFFGAEEAAIIGKTDFDFVEGALAETFRAYDLAVLDGGVPISNEEWVTFADDGRRALLLTTKTPMYNAAGELLGVLGVGRDITRQREYEQQLEQVAHFDALTHLPNRVLLADRLQQDMEHVRRGDGLLAIGYLDLDGFKPINDAYGHTVGDQVLYRLAQALKQTLRAGDTVARLGGDEFVLVLSGLLTTRDALPLLRRILKTCAEPMQLEGLRLSVSASLGITFYPQQEEVTAEQLLRQADQAMYRAKLLGKNRYQLFDEGEDSQLRTLNEELERFRRALRAGELRLFYQPKVNLRLGRVVGVEALVRWQCPGRGLLGPGEFLPLIEGHELILALGDWVLEQALTQMEAWLDQGIEMPVSINVAARQLEQPGFIGWLKGRLQGHPRVAPRLLELEVLETSALNELQRISEILHACRDLGVGFALDDFGTGYSSLAYLKRLPVTRLKIDQGFIRDLLEDPEDFAILDAVLGLANAFRLQVIAEGVESREHGVLLLQFGCEEAQGFHLARPMPPEAFLPWLQAWRPDPVWAETRRVSRDDLSALYAFVEHKAWVARVIRYLHGEEVKLPELDHRLCRFSRWLEAAPKHFNAPEALAEIARQHQHIHQLADQALARQAHWDFNEQAEQLAALRAQRDRLLEQLRELVDFTLPG